MRSSGELPAFRVHPEVLGLGVRVIAGLFVSVRNTERDPGFDADRAERLGEAVRIHGNDRWKADPVLLGFRELHSRIGVSNRDHPSASESLVRRVVRKGDLPNVNPLVDLYNLVSIETGLALGAHDADWVAWPVELRLAGESELFHPLGVDAPESVSAGEYVYADREEVICRLECRQSRKSLVSESTRNVFFIVQGNAATSEDFLEAAWERLVDRVQRWCGGEVAAVWRVQEAG